LVHDSADLAEKELFLLVQFESEPAVMEELIYLDYSLGLDQVGLELISLEKKVCLVVGSSDLVMDFRLRLNRHVLDYSLGLVELIHHRRRRLLEVFVEQMNAPLRRSILRLRARFL
jgi:hypothetical protein